MTGSLGVAGVTGLQMWLTFLVIAAASVSFALEKIPLELTAAGTITALLVLFYMLPLRDGGGRDLLGAEALLAGFANPLLFAILALLVIGQGLYQTSAFEGPARMFARLGHKRPWVALTAALLAAGIISAFLNDTPVVVMFLPLVSAVAAQVGVSQSRVLMPLAFMVILGGMTTLIGTSTNLIVAAQVSLSGLPAIGVFDFTAPGVLLASLGAIYVLLVLPWILKPRSSVAGGTGQDESKQYIAEVPLVSGHPWLGARPAAGLFPDHKGMTVRVIRRGQTTSLPPFDDVILREGDIVVVSTTRKALAEALTQKSATLSIEESRLDGNGDGPGNNGNSGPTPGRHHMTMAEAMVTPGSPHIGRSIEETNLRDQTKCAVLAVQRRARMLRTPLNQIPLQAGDVLLLLGTHNAVSGIRRRSDLLLIEWSAADLPVAHHSRKALVIFVLTVLAIVTGLVPIATAAMTGALAMILFGCLTVRQAGLALDRRIYFLIGTSFALAAALEATGGAKAIAHWAVTVFAGYGPAALLSALMLVTAIITNFLSNNATAALMTPIAISAAREIGADPAPFVYCIIFGANCSFATPIGYQVNLIVMTPGNYRFRDFVVGGLPLVVIIWLTFSLFAPLYYKL